METKHCHKCGEDKPREEFNKSSSRKDGLQSWCRDCHYKYDLANKAQIAEQKRLSREADLELARARERQRYQANRETRIAHTREWNEANPERRFLLGQRAKGHTAEQLPDGWYYRQLEFQSGGCALCGTSACKSGRRLALDHCHETGQVRGLLCAACNVRLGHHEQGRGVFTDVDQLARVNLYLTGALRHDYGNVVLVMTAPASVGVS
jgi:hypothetical protein